MAYVPLWQAPPRHILFSLLDSGTRPHKNAQKKERRRHQGTKMTESQNTLHQ